MEAVFLLTCFFGAFLELGFWGMDFLHCPFGGKKKKKKSDFRNEAVYCGSGIQAGTFLPEEGLILLNALLVRFLASSFPLTANIITSIARQLIRSLISFKKVNNFVIMKND